MGGGGGGTNPRIGILQTSYNLDSMRSSNGKKHNPMGWEFGKNEILRYLMGAG